MYYIHTVYYLYSICIDLIPYIIYIYIPYILYVYSICIIYIQYNIAILFSTCMPSLNFMPT